MLEGLPKRTDGQAREDFQTLLHALAHAVERNPDLTALICGDQSATYREYGEAVAGVAARLKGLGVEKGDRVAVSAATSVIVPQLIFGVMAAGAQVAMMNPNYTTRELSLLFDITEPKAVYCDDLSAAALTPLAHKKNIPMLNISGDPGDWRDVEMTEWPVDLPGPNDLAVLLFTGGTTGISKGVPHSHASVIAAMEVVESGWSTDLDTELFLNVPPLFHIVGLYHGVFQPVYGRSTVAFLPRFHPEEVFKVLRNWGVTVIMIGVPTAFVALMSHPDFDTADFSTVKFCASGGAPVPKNTLKDWERRTDVPALEGYGMSEGAPTATNTLKRPCKPLSVGPPVDGSEFQIVDIETGEKEKGVGEPGEIRVRGPHIAKSYFNNPDATEAAFRSGWLYTGDIAYMDEDGYVFIIDRVKDMALVSGFNVFPREIDEVLMAHPKVKEAAAIGIPDDYRGEMIKAFVTVKEGESLSEGELLGYCKDNLVKYKIPAYIEFVDIVPKTPVGKIDKKRLK
jgi:long-chain acyl-CoA synthetase